MDKGMKFWNIVRWNCRRISSVVSKPELKEEMRIFVVAGEVSGDVIGGRLMSSMKLLYPFALSFSGVGGESMRKEGLESLFPMENLSVMGLWELIPHLHNLRQLLHRTAEAAVNFRPHVVVTIDSKGFSFRLLNKIRERCAEKGIYPSLCFHYVAPSFWAWKGGEKRLNRLANVVDHMLCILPFEEDVCKRNGLAATYVGHPVLEDVIEYHRDTNLKISKWHVQGDGLKFRKEHGLSDGTTLISVLPGSRLQEVRCMLPIFSSTLDLLKDTFDDFRPVIIVASNPLVVAHIRNFIGRWGHPVVLIPGDSIEASYDAYNASTVALCTSGTAVLQLQLARLPCIVAYHTNLITEWAIKMRTKLQYISLPNILADSAILPEALFSDCTPSKLASLIRDLVESEDAKQRQTFAAERTLETLSPPERTWTREPVVGSMDKLKPVTPSMIAASTILKAVT